MAVPICARMRHTCCVATDFAKRLVSAGLCLCIALQRCRLYAVCRCQLLRLHLQANPILPPLVFYFEYW